MEKKRLVIYGTNEYAEAYLKSLNYDFEYVIDNDSAKWGSTFCQLVVYSPERLKNEDLNHIFVMLAFNPLGAAFKQVSNQLMGLGLVEDIHFIAATRYLPAEFPYEEIRPRNDYAPWKTDTSFQSIFQVIRNFTLVDIYRAYALWSYVEQVSHLQGNIIEVGVWRGGTGALIAKKAELCNIDAEIYLCDTFSGVVKADSIKDNNYRGGEHSDTTEQIVKDLVEKELKLNRVHILKGIFPDETQDDISNSLFRLCHIDVDVYYSAKHIFEWAWERLVVGGVVIFDDYGFMACKGVTDLVNELKSRNDAFFVYNLNGQGVLIKIK
jgi:O-methyltransferase